MTKLHHYFVGDIHACLSELLALELKIKADAAAHEATAFIISVGDLVDRGPDAAGVVGHFREGVKAGTHAAIMGNHEYIMLQAIQNTLPELLENIPIPAFFISLHETYPIDPYAKQLSFEEYCILQRLLWTGQGGTSTLASYGAEPNNLDSWRKISRDDLAFIASLPLVFETPKAVTTHAFADTYHLSLARLYPALPLDMNTRKQLSSVFWSRRKPPKRPDLEKIHISGHTPSKNVRRHRLRNCIQIDTACVYGERLTAYCAETGGIIQVEAVRKYF